MKNPNTIKPYLLTVLLVTIGFTNVDAQKSTETHFITNSIKIDGVVNEQDWIDYLEDGNFIQSEPSAGEASQRKSEIAVLNDANYLYILAIFHVDSKAEIKDQLTERDDIGNGDFLGLQIDPFGEAREGYDFSINAAGVQYDEKISDQGRYRNFNVVWESAVKIYADKWVVELKIPFNSIRFSKDNLDNFGINFQRYSAELNEESYWSPIDPNIDGFLNQLGKLKGLKNVDPPLNLSFNPFISIINETNASNGNKTSFSGGVDVKYVHKSAYTFDVSLIPDFSQAPSDDQIYNLSPFEVRFNENRQFFIEGTEIFDQGGYLYTRRIGGQPINNNIDLKEGEEIDKNPIATNILSLVKVTGKSNNGLSIGVLNGITGRTKATILNSETEDSYSVETSPIINYNSFVLSQQLKNNSSVTFLNNSVLRGGSTYDANLTAGLFRWYNKDRKYTFYVKSALSQQYHKNDKNVIGNQTYLFGGKVSGNWRGGVSLEMIDKNFDNNDFGYTYRNNMFKLGADISYSNNQPKGKLSRYRISLYHQQRYFFSSFNREQAFYNLSWNGNFKKTNHQLYLSTTIMHHRQDFFEARRDQQVFNRPGFIETFFEYQTNRNKPVYFALYSVAIKYLNSDQFNYTILGGYGITARIGKHISLELEQDYELNPKSAGYLTTHNDESIFGQRRVKELANTLQINYAINAVLNMNVRLRHYWIQVAHSDQYSLLDNGELMNNDYDIIPEEYDDNYSNFTIDFLAKWQFAPASFITVGYKLGSDYYDGNTRSKYISNLKSTFKDDGNHSVSLRMTYFLDANQLKRKKRKTDKLL